MRLFLFRLNEIVENGLHDAYLVTYEGLITIEIRRLNTKLKFWLLFSLSVPTILIIALSAIIINSATTLSTTGVMLTFGGVVLLGFLDIIMTYSLFARIQDRLTQSYIKISDWTQKIKQGDLTTRLTFSKQSDLYYIAESFNTMADIMQELIVSNENKIQELHMKNQELGSANRDLIASLVSAIEAKDKYTLGHSQRVSEYAAELADKIGMPEDKVEEIRIAGMLHDIGKIGIADNILTKPAKLTKDEYEEVKKHPAIGSFILNTLDLSDSTMDAINYHHERYDGKGYPLGLTGKELSLEAQIIALSDAYDAMTSDRPYRKAMTHVEAINEIKKCANTQFNPELVSVIEKEGFSVPKYDVGGAVATEIMN